MTAAARCSAAMTANAMRFDANILARRADRDIQPSPATLMGLQPLDQPGFDQQPVETPRLRAAGAAIKQPMAALQDLLLFGEGRLKRQSGGLLDDQRQVWRLQRVERRRNVDRFEID